MAADKAPCTTNSFRHLAQAKYFDGTSCHRLTTERHLRAAVRRPDRHRQRRPGLPVRRGEPAGRGRNNYPAGTVAMANAGPGTNGSQFFLVYKDTTLPADGYTIFGTVTKGLDVVQKVADAGVEGGGGDGEPEQKVTIETVTVGKG